MNTKLFALTTLTLALSGAFPHQALAEGMAGTQGVNGSMAKPVIKSWTTEHLSPTSSRIVVSMAGGAAAMPKSFRGTDGDYYAFDFTATSVNAVAKPALGAISNDIIGGTRWAEANGRTRLVVNTSKTTVMALSVEGSDIVATFTETGRASPAATVAAATEVQGTAVAGQVGAMTKGALLRDVMFKKSGNANGILTLDVSDPAVKVRVSREGTNLVVDLPNTTLPRNLAKRVNVETTGSPVTAIVPSSSRDGATRVVLETKGGWDYSFAQSGNQLAVTVVKISDDYRVGGQKVFTGKVASFDFQSMDVRSMLQVIADFTGINLIATDTVTGSMTLRLKNVPWDQALDAVLYNRNLDMRRSGNIITVAPKEEIEAREKKERDSRLEREASEPTVTEKFQLNYHQVDDVKALIEASNGDGSSSSGEGSKLKGIKLRADKRTNQLFATGTNAQIEEARGIINSVDVANRQVVIEAKIVEVSDSFEKNIGVKFGFNNTTNNLANAGSKNLYLGTTIDGNMANIGGGAGAAAMTPLAVNLPASGIGGANPGSFAFTLFNTGMTRFLNLEVQALESDGKAKTISSPRVVTADNEEAMIKQGEEIPYQQASSSGATTVTFKTAAMVLKVKPQITPSGKVILKLDINKDSVGRSTASGFGIDTKAITTKVLVDNGGTIVIGGIFITDERDTVNKIPVLADIPLFGNAFKNKAQQTNRKELVIMVTPRVIDGTGGTPVQ